MLRAIIFINKNFLPLSAAATAFAVAAAILFITGYLLVFDTSLIWFIEYQDIFKFALIASSLLTSSLIFLGVLSDYVKIIQSDKKFRYAGIAILSAFFLLIHAIPAYQSYTTGQINKVLYEIVSLLLIYIVATLVFMIVDYWAQIKNGGSMTIGQNSAIFIFISISILTVGASYGMKIKSTESNRKDIIVKNTTSGDTTYQKSRIIIFLSHHTIFEYENKLNIIPSSDIIRIVSSEPVK